MKTRLSALADRAVAGEAIVIARNGVPRARLVPIARRDEHRARANAMGISRVATSMRPIHGLIGCSLTASREFAAGLPLRPLVGWADRRAE